MGTSVKESARLEAQFIEKYKLLISEYDQIKQKRHVHFRYVKDFYSTHHLHKQTFLKYYHRFKQNQIDSSLLPKKRGPRYKTRRFLPYVENKVKELRLSGLSRYEIPILLKDKLGQFTPSPSGVYKILRRHGMSRLNEKMKVKKRAIIKDRAGELGHIDCHYVSADSVPGLSEKLYIVSVIDDYSRIAFAEVVSDIQSITVMFSALRIINVFSEQFKIRFESMMTDNGSEFGKKDHQNPDQHVFMRMLKELGIKQIWTRPYRPQTNGKIERFWRTLKEDMLEGAEYASKEELQEELWNYLAYYNYQRPHQGINGLTPEQQLLKQL